MRWDLILERQSVNRLQEKAAKAQLRDIKDSVERNQSYGFQARVAKLPEPKEIYVGESATSENRRWLYSVKLRVAKPRFRSEEAAQRQYEAMLANVIRAANTRGWRLINPQNQGLVCLAGEACQAQQQAWVEPIAEQPEERPEFKPGPLTDDCRNIALEGIYDRDDQLEILHLATLGFVSRNGDEPSHAIMYGPPAGAKTRVWRGLKKCYERDGAERVVILDATTMSKVGLEQWLLERGQQGMLPIWLVLEEIEKHDPKNLLCLLNVMATGEIQRTNARIGSQRAEAKLLIGATCNDEDALKNFHKGALWSRFVHQLYCPRPNRDRMKLIMLDKIAKMDGGNPAWADVALAYAYDEVGNDDPRFITGLLDGGDGLLDGTYLGRYRRIRQARLEDMERRGLLEQKRLEDAVAVLRRALAKDRVAALKMLGLKEGEA